MSGYDSVRSQGDAAVRALRDIAVLIGERRSYPVELESGGQIVPGLGFREDAAALAVRARDLSQGLFTIITLGEFKNGKSTLLNGMLGSKTLPAKAAPATAIITMLVYGDDERVAVHETGKAEPRMISWEEFVAEFQLSRRDQETLEGRGAVDRFQDIEYAQIQCCHPICANGVKLIDSPGLGEHVARTRLATSFLKQAQAVIFVLNATRILTPDERRFIDTVLGTGRLNHVFFVVNRINQVDPGAVDEIKDWVETALAPHFEVDGAFDRDLYNRRVFFVDAKSALDLRSSGDINEKQVERTGVPALERELERFLTGEDRLAAALQSGLQFLEQVLTQARLRIDGEKVAVDQPLVALEERRAEAERRLDALSGRKHEIERTILLFSDTVQRKVYDDLRSFVEEMHERWPEDSERLIDLKESVSISRIISSYTQPGAREQMSASIAAQVQRYLQVKFEEWAERIPTVIRADLEMMLAEVEAQMDDFQLELDEIASLFSGVRGTSVQSSGPRLLQLALSLREISGVTEEVMGTDDWAGIIARVVQQAVVVLLVSMFLGNVLVAAVIVEAIHLGLQENVIRKRIRENVGERLHQNLKAQVEEKRAFILDAMAQRFRAFAASTTDVVQGQIDEVRAEQARIVRQRQDENFSADQEKQRLDEIGRQLQRLYDQVQDVAEGSGQPSMA